jgi:hypothetical protein
MQSLCRQRVPTGPADHNQRWQAIATAHSGLYRHQAWCRQKHTGTLVTVGHTVHTRRFTTPITLYTGARVHHYHSHAAPRMNAMGNDTDSLIFMPHPMVSDIDGPDQSCDHTTGVVERTRVNPHRRALSAHSTHTQPATHMAKYFTQVQQCQKHMYAGAKCHERCSSMPAGTACTKRSPGYHNRDIGTEGHKAFGTASHRWPGQYHFYAACNKSRSFIICILSRHC